MNTDATRLDPELAARLKRDAAGLLTAVVQDRSSGEVLMVGWMDDEALRRTLTTGRSTFWSRSRQQYWVKGESSGHRQWVHEVRLDCDGDTLLVRVRQEGPACHTGARTCFDDGRLDAVTTDPLDAVVTDPLDTPVTDAPDSEGTDPEGTDPEGTDPEGTDPEGTDPEGTDPEGTDRPVTGDHRVHA